MGRRDLIFLLNLIEFLFESDSSPGSNDKIKSGEFRNALSAYLDVNLPSSETLKNSEFAKVELPENNEKMKKELNSLQEQVASLNSMTEMTINYMQESISRLEQENKKVANSVKFVEKVIDTIVTDSSKIPFQHSLVETSNNQDFVIISTVNKMGIFYALMVEKPFKDISKSIFALFANYVIEQIITSKRTANASFLMSEIENYFTVIQERIGGKDSVKLNLAACIIDKQMGELEYATNSFPLYILNKGYLASFTEQSNKAEQNDKYFVERVLIRESSELFFVVGNTQNIEADLKSKITTERDINAKIKEITHLQEDKNQQGIVLGVKF
jgi:hypothetical protein